MSVSGDGKMLVWKYDRKTKKLELNNGYVDSFNGSNVRHHRIPYRYSYNKIDNGTFAQS